MKRLSALIGLLALCVAMSAVTSERTFMTLGTTDGLSDNSAQTLMCLPDGRLLITTQDRVNIYDGSRFSHVATALENVYELSGYEGQHHLSLDRHGHLWLKNRRQIRCIDLKTEQCVGNIGPFGSGAKMRGKVKDLFVTTDGSVWYAIGDSLLGFDAHWSLRLPREAGTLQELEMWKDNQLLLFFDNGGAALCSMRTGKLKQLPRAYEGSEAAEFSTSTSVVRDSDIIYQIRSGEQRSRLLRFDVDKGEWTTILTTPYHLNDLSLADGQLYVPCEQGFWQYSTADGQLEHHPQVKLYDGRAISTDINAICFDRQGGIWLGTEKRGLLYARPYQRQFEVMETASPQAQKYLQMLAPLKPVTSFLGEPCMCALTDSRGWKWVGTSEGIRIYKNKNQLAKRISRGDGMANEVIHSLVEDSEGNVWAATSQGVSAIMMRDSSVLFISNYTEAEGVPSEGFVDGKALRMSDNTIVMQAYDHVVRFNPSRFSTLHKFDGFLLTPTLVRVSLKGDPIRVGSEEDGRVLLPKACAFTDTLLLSFRDNMVQLTFSALNYTRPRQTYYRVRVKEISDEWQTFSPYDANGNVDRNGQLHFPLTNLRPGKYTIEVQASFFPFAWKGGTKQLHVSISEPWWRGGGMRLIGILLIAGIILLCFFLYTQNLRAKLKVANTDNQLTLRLRRFFDRCKSWKGQTLAPNKDDSRQGSEGGQNELTDEQVRALMRLRSHIYDPDVTLDQLSEQANLPVEEIYGLFSSALSRSPRRFIIAERMETAAHKIGEGTKDIDALARELHFVNADHFRRCFQQYHGCRPEDLVK